MAEIVYKKLNQLKLLGNNPRQIQDADFQRLCESLERNPDYFEARPVILSNRTGDEVIIAGNMRYRAAKKLKLKEVPTILLSDQAEIIFRDNINNGQWDLDRIANEWTDFPLEDWGLEIPELAFGEAPEEDEQGAADAINKAAELQKKWGTASGQLWKLGEHRLVCGDCTDKATVERLMQGEVATLAPVDPPYNVGFVYDGETVDDSKTAEVYQSFTKDWFAARQSASQRQIVTPGCYNLASWCRWFDIKHVAAWTKTNSMTNGVVSRFWCWEPLLFFGDAWPRKRPNDVFDFPIGQQKETANHPCPKPLKMWGDLIENYSEPSDLIFDSFVGSGTTLIACEERDRRCRGMEISPEYIAVALERWHNLTGKQPELIEQAGAADA
jgi:DNA modification methylase